DLPPAVAREADQVRDPHRYVLTGAGHVRADVAGSRYPVSRLQTPETCRNQGDGPRDRGRGALLWRFHTHRILADAPANTSAAPRRQPRDASLIHGNRGVRRVRRARAVTTSRGRGAGSERGRAT